jgi:hypothetical protein
MRPQIAGESGVNRATRLLVVASTLGSKIEGIV